MVRASTPIVHALRLYCEAERMMDRLLHASGYRRKYYSQKRQDRWVVERVFNRRRNGYFVEVGAGDGRTHSNTYILERDYGWKGVLIDANPEYFAEISKHRSCTNICACVDYECHPVEFFQLGYLGGIIADDTDHSRQKRSALLKKETKKITCMHSRTLAQILGSIGAPAQIQYLSIDVEGAEFRILNKFPFDRYEFEALTVERPTRAVHCRLIEAGYVLEKTKLCDGFYVSARTAARLEIEPKLFAGMPPKFF